MREPTDAEIQQMRFMRTVMIMQGGHLAYQFFMGEELTHPIQIDGLAAPLGFRPEFVAFKNEDLIGRSSANDVDNPDGGKPVEGVFEKINALLQEIKQPVPVEVPKKRASLTLVK